MMNMLKINASSIVIVFVLLMLASELCDRTC